MQCPLYTFGIASDDGEIGLSRLVGFGAALFPIPQSSKRDVVPDGELFLGKPERASEGLDAWNRTQLPWG